MMRYEKKFRLLAMCFAALAGFVDAIGFLKSGGLFVSFMSGNSTRVAIGIEEASPIALAAASLILLFVLGVALSVIVGSIAGKNRKVTASAVVAVLLLAAACFESLGLKLEVVGALCLAMGASNAIFQRDGEVSIGVTYMTGTLVRLGHRIADAFLGGSRTAWLPYLMLWLSLVIGGVGGAIVFRYSALASLWGAAGVSAVLVLVVWRLSAGREV